MKILFGVIAMLLVSVLGQNFAGEGVPFQCGGTTLIQHDFVPSETVIQGGEWSVTVKVTNVGTQTGEFTTNFLFIDPNSKIVDGSRPPTRYTLKPGQHIILTWIHGFGCGGRPKGEYYLNIGTQPAGTNQACNYTYHDVVLLNDTLCVGFNP